MFGFSPGTLFLKGLYYEKNHTNSPGISSFYPKSPSSSSDGNPELPLAPSGGLFNTSKTESYRLLQNAHGKIPYNCTNDYMFQAFLQENNDALKHLVCSIQHLDPASVKSIRITNPIILGKTPEHKTFILDVKAQLHDGSFFNLEMQVEDLKTNSQIKKTSKYILTNLYYM